MKSLLIRFFGFLFSLAFLCGGIAALWQMTLKPGMTWQKSREWWRIPAVIERSQLEESKDSDGSTYGIEVVYSYQVAGKDYRGNRYGLSEGKTNVGVKAMRKEVERLAPGSEVKCWVNPVNPAESMLTRSLSLMTMAGFFFCLPFLTVGIIGTGATVFGPAVSRCYKKSRERLLRQLIDDGRLCWPKPFEPAQIWSATGLRVLFSQDERLMKAAGFTALGLFWNGIVGVFIVLASVEALGGNQRLALGLSLFLIPFIMIGASLIWRTGQGWSRVLLPNWVAVIDTPPGFEGGKTTLSAASLSTFTPVSSIIKRLRLVAMASPIDSESEKPSKPFSGFISPRKRAKLPDPGGQEVKPHELVSVEVVVPDAGQRIVVDYPVVPAAQGNPRLKWGRYWDLEIEYPDEMIECFQISA